MAQEERTTQLVLPDGCMDVIFSFHAPRGAEATAVGTMTRPLAVDVVGTIHLFGVRFRPGAAGAFIPVPARTLTDQVVSLDDIDGWRPKEITDRLAQAVSDQQRVAVLADVLRQRLAQNSGRLDDMVLSASEHVATARGTSRVDDLADRSGVGRRQLERRFLAAVGISPKFACRVARFREVVALMHGARSMPLSQVALETGYADQPHMSREFKALSGVSPAAYRRSIGASAETG